MSDDTLTRCISELRTQLGKYSSQSSLIETLPKRGYRWVPPVPVYVSQQDQQLIAADLDDILKNELLATDNLRFFAQSAAKNGSQKSFP